MTLRETVRVTIVPQFCKTCNDYEMCWRLPLARYVGEATRQEAQVPSLSSVTYGQPGDNQLSLMMEKFFIKKEWFYNLPFQSY